MRYQAFVVTALSIGVLLTGLIFQKDAQAANGRQAKVFVLDGQTQLCDKGQTDNPKCKAVQGDAASLKTTSSTQAKFFAQARASWLATTPEAIYLCAVPAGTNVSKCVQFPQPRQSITKIEFQRKRTVRPGLCV